jgi:uncharacterized protein YecE (DUF72 family)
MAQAFIGTSGFDYPEWKPSFYPEDLSRKNFLGFYVSQFRSVELNNTFYQIPNAAKISAWCAVAPEHFRFVMKAPRRITHNQRLSVPSEALQFFLQAASGLNERLGALLFQLPPFFKCSNERLSSFMEALPPGIRTAFEFRHDSWFADDIFACLKQHNRALCIAETEERTTPDVVTADFCYYRYRKPEYTPEERQAMLRRMQEHLANGRDTYAYFKHEETPQGALYAVDVLKQAGTASAL